MAKQRFIHIGFPRPKTRGDVTVDEAIDVTGYFFKRHVFPSRQGPRTAPLLLAKIPAWKRVERRTSPPDMTWIVGASMFAAVFAVGLATIVYRRSRRSSEGAMRLTVHAADDRPLAELGAESLLPTPEETLARLAESEAGERPPPSV